jgi:hypothetical protein
VQIENTAPQMRAFSFVEKTKEGNVIRNILIPTGVSEINDEDFAKLKKVKPFADELAKPTSVFRRPGANLSL